MTAAKKPITIRISSAGIDASAHLIMNMIIELNGIRPLGMDQAEWDAQRAATENTKPDD